MDNQYALTVISAAAIIWMVWRAARLQRRRAGPPGRPLEATITWLGSYTAAFQRALDICGLLELEVVDADPNRGSIHAKAALGMQVRIAIKTQEGVTTLTLCVGSGMVEVGQSQRLVKRFVEIWDRMPEPV